jgi:hypothetical protein
MKTRSLWDDMGFTKGAENLNGRLAMIAFMTAILVEIFTGKGFLAFLKLL